jgi:hypothetical protein
MGLAIFGKSGFACNRSALPFESLILQHANKSKQLQRALDISSSQASAIGAPSEVEIRLNDLVGEAVSQGLSHFGGENVVESLIYILELEHSVQLRNIANQVLELRKGLEKMFGDAAYVIEGHVCSNLAKTLGLDPRGRTLEELVEAARDFVSQNYEQSSKTP